MGYCMNVRETNFDVTDEWGALEAIRSLAGRETIRDSSGRHFSWVDTDEFLYADTLDDALEAWRWSWRRQEKWIEFLGEKSGDDELLFDAIAPYVKTGSYIEMQGEDGTIWRWVFNGETCREVTAKIVFENNNE